ncbi:MAG: deaminase [Acidimicrobiia bacterium]
MTSELNLADLTPPWQEAFKLAWESLLAGSPPVGAVVMGTDGAIVARGRSRRSEPLAPPGQLAGSRLAHAEVNALAQLPVDGTRDHVLLVTLEPCFLCVAAAAMSHVRAVEFAGIDPIWRFLQDLPSTHPALQERWFAVDGPMPGPFGLFASLLPLLERIERDPSGARVDAYGLEHPALVELARDTVGDQYLDKLRHGTLHDALRKLGPQLMELATPLG